MFKCRATNNNIPASNKAMINSKRLYLDTTDAVEGDNHASAQFLLDSANILCQPNEYLTLNLVEAVVSSSISLFAPTGPSRPVFSVSSTENTEAFAFLYITEKETNLPAYNVVPKDLNFLCALSQLGSTENIVTILNKMLDARTTSGEATTRFVLDDVTGVISKEGAANIIIENRWGWDQTFTGEPDPEFTKTSQAIFAALGIPTSGPFQQFTTLTGDAATNPIKTPAYTPRLPLLVNLSTNTGSVSSGINSGRTLACIPVDGVHGLLNERTIFITQTEGTDVENLTKQNRNANIVYTSKGESLVQIGEQHLSEISVSLVSTNGEPLFCPYGISYEIEVQWHTAEK